MLVHVGAFAPTNHCWIHDASQRHGVHLKYMNRPWDDGDASGMTVAICFAIGVGPMLWLTAAKRSLDGW